MEIEQRLETVKKVYEVVKGMDVQSYHACSNLIMSQLESDKHADIMGKIQEVQQEEKPAKKEKKAAKKEPKPFIEDAVKDCNKAIEKTAEPVEEENGEEVEYNRSAIKLELDQLNIEYNNKVNTKNLYKLLVSSKATKEVEKEVAQKIEEDNTRKVDVDEAREVLKNFSLDKGNPKALEILQGLGASKLSELTAETRLEMVNIIEQGRY